MRYPLIFLGGRGRGEKTMSILVHNSRHRILVNDWWLNINSNISFHFRLFPGKTKSKIFQKKQKTLFWEHLAPFCPNLGKNEFFLKTVLLLKKFKNIPIIHYCAKKSKNNYTMVQKTGVTEIFLHTIFIISLVLIINKAMYHKKMDEIKTITFQFNISSFMSFQRPLSPLSSTHQY